MRRCIIGTERSGTLSREELERLVESGEIDTVIVAFPDQFGQLMGKRLTAPFFLEHGGVVESCNYLLTTSLAMDPLPGFASSGWDQGYGDYRMVPDPATLRRLTWPETTALVIADLHTEDGEDVPHAPRSILRRQCTRAAQFGFSPMMASELEFHLFVGTPADPAAALRPSTTEPIDYQIQGTEADEEVLHAIRTGIDGAGIPVESSKGETGPGQYEIALRYADAMRSADRHVAFKHGVKAIVPRFGRSVSFMAKYATGASGSSGHVHTSLYNLDRTKNVFWDDTRGEGSLTYRRFLAGLCDLSTELFLFVAPTVNSYKRFCAGSFAPTRLAWGRDNRTTAFRVVGHADSFRIENRFPGSDMNPYLAYAAILAAGLHGIEHELEPPAEFRGNAYEGESLAAVPATLGEAADRLDRSERARAIFGDEVVDHYVLHALHEERAAREHVTDWERARYLNRI